MLTRMRIWLPDAPGVLGAVAAEIGAVNGNVIGLEVLEREAGVAIDELVVELPDEPGAVEAACRGVRNVPGAGVEEVTELLTGAPDREVTVLAAAAGILQAATAPGGYNVVCVFNDRQQDLTAHPGFTPTLLRHTDYLGLYSSWELVYASDEDLHEIHPHNGVPHMHSLTRLIARKNEVID